MLQYLKEHILEVVISIIFIIVGVVIKLLVNNSKWDIGEFAIVVGLCGFVNLFIDHYYRNKKHKKENQNSIKKN
jgi:uncharacterized membrane protein